MVEDWLLRVQSGQQQELKHFRYNTIVPLKLRAQIAVGKLRLICFVSIQLSTKMA